MTFLTAEESQALLDAPPQNRWEGRRDHAMLTLALQAGLRVSELVAVNCGDITLSTGGSVRVEGKGRKHRAVPLTQEAKAVLAVWIAERGGKSQGCGYFRTSKKCLPTGGFCRESVSFEVRKPGDIVMSRGFVAF